MEIKIVPHTWIINGGARVTTYAVFKDGLPFREYTKEECDAFLKGLIGGMKDGI